jgi:pimeloyl-ACP methyl ester carboxylesterase
VTPPPEPLYLALDPDPVFAVLHPAPGPHPHVAVLLCSPFGWDEMNSHRGRRAWAEHLAADGIPTLRFDLPGTGDSGGGPLDPDRVPAWTDAVSRAADWLRGHTGCECVAVIGIGLGGLIAGQAAADGAAIDDLVLWGVPAHGRTVVRELNAFARLEGSRLAGQGAPSAPPTPEGTLVAAGYPLSLESRRALEAIDLSALAADVARDRSILLLGRDGLRVDERLEEALAGAGADLTVSEGSGYGEMVLGDMHVFRVPHATFAGVSRWLRRETATPACTAPLAPPPAALAQAELRVSEVPIRERAIDLDVPGARLAGVLSEPAGDRVALTGVLLNAGSQRRTGPSRMWVEIARRWAAAGVPTVRIDVAGIGDADGVPLGWGDAGVFYDGSHGAQVRAALDTLVAEGFPPRFLLLGLCSGANWAFHAGVADERVSGAVLLNPGALFWNRWTSLSQLGRQARRVALVTMWRRLRAREIGPAAALRAAVAAAIIPGRVATPLRRLRRRVARRLGRPSRLAVALERLEANGCHVDLAFTDREPQRDDLAASGGLAELEASPCVELELIASGAETHTMQPQWIQQRVHAIADRALDRQLARQDVSASPTDGRPSIERARASAYLNVPGASTDTTAT